MSGKVNRQIRFTGNVDAKKMSFIIGKNSNELYEYWYTLLETVGGSYVTVGGSYVTVSGGISSSSVINRMGADTREEAIKKGKVCLEKLDESYF